MIDPLTTYLQTLVVSQGRRAGERFKALPWQRRFVRHAFRAGVKTAALSVARGNGKSALLAGIAAATLDGPLAVPRGECLIVAASFSQGRVIYEFARAYLGDKLADRRRWRTWDTAQQASIENRATGARVRVLASDPRRAHGLAPVLTLADEPAQWPASTGERLLAALRTASGKQPESRFIALGTRPADPAHWFSRMLAGGADYSQCHAAVADDPPFRKRTWAKANPSMAHMPDLLAAIRDEAKEAKSDVNSLPSFEALRLNLGTADETQAFLLDAGTWKRIEGHDAEQAGRCVWGLDLGTSAAQSAVAAYWPETGLLDCVAAFPRSPGLAERGIRDGVGNLYKTMHKRGELILAGGRAVEIGALLSEALSRFGAPVAVAADRWRAPELADALTAARVPVGTMAIRGQGFKDGAADVREFRRAVLSGAVKPVTSLLLRNAVSEARTAMDVAGNAKLAKQSEAGRRLRARDDAAAAAILAVAMGARGRPATRPRRHFVVGG